MGDMESLTHAWALMMEDADRRSLPMRKRPDAWRCSQLQSARSRATSLAGAELSLHAQEATRLALGGACPNGVGLLSSAASICPFGGFWGRALLR